MLGKHLTGKLPFETVYLHGLVLDAKGQKMSKSKGNVINPLDLTDKFGTDAFRMGLVVGNTPGTSLALAEDKIKAYKHFANKIWNASRFVLENCQDFDQNSLPKLDQKDTEDLTLLQSTIKEITADMENFKFYLGAEKIYHYFWHEFADKIIEESKPRLNSGNKEEKQAVQYKLLTILKTSLKLLHPFMPFVTEELWSMIPKTQDEENILMIEKWPT